MKSIFLLIILLLVMIIIGPFLTIWSLNTLFATGIPYTIWTWLAILWIQAIIGLSFSNARK
jgi:hypothetical protein